MAIFARSLFRSMLERIVDENSAPEEETPSLTIRGLTGGFVAQANPSVGGAALEDAYRDFPNEIAPQQMPAFLARLEIGEVREDLDFTAQDTALSLKVKRREFARLNHPDRVDSAYRAQANIRMTLANQLIDAALKALKS